MAQRGGIGSGLDSKTQKGVRREAQAKGPGRPAKRQATKAQLRQEKMAAGKKLKADRQEKAKTDHKVRNLLPTVQNARGHCRSFEQNTMFLTLFCNMYLMLPSEGQGDDSLTSHIGARTQD